MKKRIDDLRFVIAFALLFLYNIGWIIIGSAVLLIAVSSLVALVTWSLGIAL